MTEVIENRSPLPLIESTLTLYSEIVTVSPLVESWLERAQGIWNTGTIKIGEKNLRVKETLRDRIPKVILTRLPEGSQNDESNGTLSFEVSITNPSGKASGFSRAVDHFYGLLKLCQEDELASIGNTPIKERIAAFREWFDQTKEKAKV